MTYQLPVLENKYSPISIDTELHKPTRDCDSPRIWPGGKWLTDLLLSSHLEDSADQKHNFRFWQDGERLMLEITKGQQSLHPRVDYLVVAQWPYKDEAKGNFSSHESFSYMDGIDNLYFADPTTKEIITTQPKHEKQRKDLEEVVRVVSAKLDVIRREDDPVPQND
jgi:hypothetical protein